MTDPAATSRIRTVLAQAARAIRLPANRPRVAAGLALLATIAIIGTLTLGPRPAPTSIASPGPTAGHSPGSTPGPTVTTADWDDLTLGADTQLARITVNGVASRNIPAKASFTMTSLQGLPAVELARGLQVEPSVPFEVRAGSTADLATIHPTRALRDGTRYRFRLLAPDGSLAGSWAFRTTSPLHIVTRIPDDRTTEVPLGTGIEIGFDQDTPTEIATHFRIAPAVKGRFEAHGRTWAFVPDRPLEPDTLYTVTVTRGVGLTGSEQVLEADVRWQFETASKAAGGPPAHAAFDHPIIEARPGQPVDLALYFVGDDEAIPATVPFDLFRVPGRQAAMAAARTLADAPDWAEQASNTLVPTSGLTRVVHADLAFQRVQNGRYYAVRLPAALDPGWYLAVLPATGRDDQALLQVSDLGIYAVASESRSIAWAVDLKEVAGIPGVVLSRADGSQIGRTAASGLMNVATPRDLLVPSGYSDSIPVRLLLATDPDGRELIVPLGMAGGPTTLGGQVYGRDTNDWWTLLATERDAYHPTDTVHVWGLARSRDDRTVPADLELRLHPFGGSADAPIDRVSTKASARGVFTAELQLVDLPSGEYEIDLFAGSDRLMTTTIGVGDIRKPAYRLDIVTDHRAYLVGQAVVMTTSAVFFDGTAAPGLSLTLSDGRVGTTDANGRLVVSTPATVDPLSTVTTVFLGVGPTHPEEGEIRGDTAFIVLPSQAWLAGSATLEGTQIRLTGSVANVDFAKADRQVATEGSLADPSGDPMAGHAVTATVIHEVPVQRQVGTSYDFVLKRVVPIYEYSVRMETIASRTLTSDGSGRFALSVEAPVASDGYHIELGTSDAKGRRAALSVFASRTYGLGPGNAQPYLDEPLNCGFGSKVVGLGETAELTYHEGNGAVGTGGAFLFVVGNRGLEAAAVQSSPTLARSMTDAELPGFVVRGIHLTAAGFSPTTDRYVEVDRRDKAIAVTLTPDAARYAPGDHVNVGVRTADAAGRPIAADVVMRGVDEKLFAIGAAHDIDPLDDLYGRRPGSGLLQSFTSHVLPSLSLEGCGDEGGGRQDFRDLTLFERIQTDATGRGTIGFDLPDDLTSWHLSATAMSGGLDVGSASVLIPVGLPFFADAILAPSYLVGEQVVLRVRTYGDALKAGQQVRVTVSGPTLGLAPVRSDGPAFAPLRFSLPALPLGDHRITIEASVVGSSGPVADKLTRTVRVIPSRLRQLAYDDAPLATGLALPGGDGLTTYVITDAGRGGLLPLLHQLADGSNPRFDAAFAADLARQLLVDEFDVPDAELPPSSFDREPYMGAGNGIRLLAYSSPDIFLTAKAALVAADSLDRDRIASGLYADGPEATREQRIVALAGSAALGGDVLDDLRSIDPTTLTIREQLWLGLGLLALGDEDAARAIERSLLEQFGQRQGPWVRLVVGGTLETTLEGSALLLMLAGGLGDPLAARVSRYLVDNPSREALFSLEQLAYVRASLDRLPRTAASFAWTLDGERHIVTLKPGESFALTLTAKQRTGLALEALTGQLVVTSTWLGSTSPAALPKNAAITITRTATPTDDARDDQLIIVRLKVDFGPAAPIGCYDVTDVLPSGLAPVVTPISHEAIDALGPDVLRPHRVDGQYVTWCVDPSWRRSNELVYAARVVSPGTYTWEPAVVQSATAPGIGAATTTTTFTIR